MKITEEILTQYMLKETNAMENQEIEKQLSSDSDLNATYEELAGIWQSFQDSQLEKPSEKSEKRFTAWLSQQEESVSKPRQVIHKLKFLKYAAALAVLVLSGFWLMSPETAESNVAINPVVQDDLIHWAASPSSTARIRGIYRTTTVDNNENDVVDILLKLMHEDESASVRLTAIEALQTFDMTNNITQSFTTALAKETKPVVQIALITALVGLSDNSAKPHFEALVDREETDQTVKDEALLGLMRL